VFRRPRIPIHSGSVVGHPGDRSRHRRIKWCWPRNPHSLHRPRLPLQHRCPKVQEPRRVETVADRRTERACAMLPLPVGKRRVSARHQCQGTVLLTGGGKFTHRLINRRPVPSPTSTIRNPGLCAAISSTGESAGATGSSPSISQWSGRLRRRISTPSETGRKSSITGLPCAMAARSTSPFFWQSAETGQRRRPATGIWVTIAVEPVSL